MRPLRGLLLSCKQALVNYAPGMGLSTRCQWLDADIYVTTSAGSGNLRPLDGLGSSDDLAEPGISDVPVPPGDVAADHAGLLPVGGVVGAVEGEVLRTTRRPTRSRAVRR